jgi:hypothetical protein
MFNVYSKLLKKPPKGSTKEDVKENYWKFNWKPPTEEDDPIPQWTDPQVILDDLMESVRDVRAGRKML